MIVNLYVKKLRLRVDPKPCFVEIIRQVCGWKRANRGILCTRKIVTFLKSDLSRMGQYATEHFESSESSPIAFRVSENLDVKGPEKGYIRNEQIEEAINQSLKTNRSQSS